MAGGPSIKVPGGLSFGEANVPARSRAAPSRARPRRFAIHTVAITRATGALPRRGLLPSVISSLSPVTSKLVRLGLGNLVSRQALCQSRSGVLTWTWPGSPAGRKSRTRQLSWGEGSPSGPDCC